MNLNLSAWIARREKDIGPYADHIIAGVKEYEREIERLRRALADIADGMGETKLVEIGRFAPVIARQALSTDHTKEPSE